jgi:putative membrane protein
MAHEKANTLLEHFRDEGDCQMLRDFAAQMSPVVKEHLDHMKRLETNMAR